MRSKIFAVTAIMLVAIMCLIGCGPNETIAEYTVPMVDLDNGIIYQGALNSDTTAISSANLEKYSEMFGKKTIVADKNDFGKDYMAHPDSVLLRRQKAGSDDFEFTNEILTMFPLGHGFGELKGKISYDGGLSYTETLANTPNSFKRSAETPTIYRLTFSDDNVPDDNDKLILISGNPAWSRNDAFNRPKMDPNGFNVSLSSPSIDANGDKVEGREWTNFETWYGHGKKTANDEIIKEPLGKDAHDCIVAMSTLVRLKEKDENGNMVWADKWMGLFHNRKFDCYKTILTFEDEEHTIMNWSRPVKYFSAYEEVEHKSNMCEVECVRSDAGKGDTLAIITRSNSKKINSLISFSTDEGETWSAPKEAPMALNGERHKAEWVKVQGKDKLFITFRSIDRSTEKVKNAHGKKGWMSEGYVAWVGDWDDLVNATEGDFRVKIAHVYNGKQKTQDRVADADTGYSGNVVLPNGKVATCSYGKFSPSTDTERGNTTYIVGRVVDVAGLYDILGIKA